MTNPTEESTYSSHVGAPFLPLAMRFTASFALLVLHIAIEQEAGINLLGEWVYVFFLTAIFLESSYEAGCLAKNSGSPFAVPSQPMILMNLFVFCFLVTIIVAFHGIDKPGLAALYVFPVMASAFYVGITTIIGVGVISAVMYALCVVLFSGRIGLSFGYSGVETGIGMAEQVWLIAFTTLQVLIATLVAVTIRRRLETLDTSLSESTAIVDKITSLYHNVVDSMSSGLVTMDLKGVLTSVNPSAERILHSKLHIGRPFKALDAIELAVAGTTPNVHHFEWSLVTPCGKERLLGGTISPLMNNYEQQTGFLLLFEDITEMKTIEIKMKLSERLAAIGELSAELAHEMRTPIASVQGCIQILRRQDSNSAITDKVMTILLRESERIGAVVSDFLELARPRDLKIESLWFPRLIEEVEEAWDTDKYFSCLQVKIDIAPDVWINGDSLAFYQIMTNLMSNSRKAVQGRINPTIKISSAVMNGKLELTFLDNGKGMSKSQINDIFVPFRSNFDEGTGIGMSIVYQLTQRMSWDIHIDSEIEIGTKTKLFIPLLENFE